MNQMSKCPSCGHDNLPGEDRCVQCLCSLMQKDLPKPRKDDVIQRVLMTSPISDLVTGRDLLVASVGDDLKKITSVLQKRKLDCVLIYQKQKLVGILSIRDIILKTPGKKMDFSTLKVESIMTPNPEFVFPHDPIAYVVNKMAVGGCRHVPVVSEDGRPITIISINDILRYVTDLTKQINYEETRKD